MYASVFLMQIDRYSFWPRRQSIEELNGERHFQLFSDKFCCQLTNFVTSRCHLIYFIDRIYLYFCLLKATKSIRYKMCKSKSL